MVPIFINRRNQPHRYNDCCRRAARDGNGGAKLSLDQFLAAVPKIKYEYETELRTYSCLLADSRGGNKSLKRTPHKRCAN
mgnify:CR=1 FL=1